MTYNWQQADWPDFTYDADNFRELLESIAEETARISITFKALPENIEIDTVVSVMVEEAMKTSEIEGEYLNKADVTASIRNKLGLTNSSKNISDKKAQGAGELMVLLRNTYTEKLTEEMLFEWHSILMSQSTNITIGGWRTHAGPMQVFSGPPDDETIHFEAPSSPQVPAEMTRFITWFNDTAPGGSREILKAPLRASIAHLYFESIHPFDDGNGRIGRAIAEKALSETIGRPVMLSLSQAIESNRKLYYYALENAQKHNEISEWLEYFLAIINLAQKTTRKLIDFTLLKAAFFERHISRLNERQHKALSKMLESPSGFKGGMTVRKYISITKASKTTATEDLKLLTDIEALQAEGDSENIHYSIRF